MAKRTRSRKPEKSRARRKNAPPASKQRKSLPKRSDAIHVQDLGGKPVELVYTRDGTTYRHRFGRGVKLYATSDGEALFITGGTFRVRLFLEG